MTFKHSLALAAILGGASVVATAPAAAAAQDEAPKIKISKQYRDAYVAARKPYDKEDYAAALAAWEQGLPSVESEDDRVIAGQMALDIGVKTQDTALQRRGLDMMLGTQRLTAQQRGNLAFYAGRYAYDAGETDKAIEYLRMAEQAGNTSSNVYVMLAESSFKKQNIPEGLSHLKKAIDAQNATGEAAPVNWYQRGAGQAYESGDAQAMEVWAKELVKTHPTPEHWRSAVAMTRRSTNFTNAANLDISRLMFQTDALESERDYAEYVDAADPRRLPGEVKAAIESGIAKGDITATNPYLSEQLNIAQSRISADRASLASSESDARASADGKIALATGDAYLGYDDYAKASAMYGLALEKGVAETDRANMRLAIAEIGQADYAAAKAALSNIASGEYRKVADLWQIWVDNQTKPAAAAPAETEPASTEG